MSFTLTRTAIPGSNASLSFRVLPLAAADEALALWRSLELRLGSGSVANSATWTQCWLETYGTAVPVKFLIGEANGQVQGICLLADGPAERMGPFRVRTAHVGTAGEPQPGSVCVEYNRLLAAPEYHDQFLNVVVAELKRDGRWDQLKLDGFSQSELQPWLEKLPGAEIRSRDSKFFDLRAARENGGEILPRLGGNTRSNLKRRLKKYGELQTEWATSVDQATDIFEELVGLHQARWQAIGQPGAFASQRFLDFQRRISVRLFLENKLVLFRARHEAEAVGCLLLLVDNNRLLDYVSGLASFDAKPSPGLTTHYLCMNEALRRGFDAYDFLVGDKQHKDNLSDNVNQLCWLTWSRPRVKLQAISWLRRMKQKLQKSSPAVPAEAAE